MSDEQLILLFSGEMYYLVFKSVQPGTELFVWYGDEYGDFLEIDKFEPPRYYHANRKYSRAIYICTITYLFLFPFLYNYFVMFRSVLLLIPSSDITNK